MTKWIVAALALSGCGSFERDLCNPPVPDGCRETYVQSLSCDVRWADGTVASGVKARCTGSEASEGQTDSTGRFDVNVTVTTGGFAGWEDDCDSIEFGDGAVKVLDGGTLITRRMNGAINNGGCTVTVE